MYIVLDSYHYFVVFITCIEFCHPEATKGPLLQRVPVQTLGQPSTMIEGVANGSEGKRKG